MKFVCYTLLHVGDLSESAKQSFPQSHSGYFLWQDEKQRWQRCWGRVEYRSACLYIYEDSNEEVLLKTFSLESTTTKYEDQSLTEANFEKENSFVVSGVNLESSVSSESSLVKSCVDVHFAAYTDSERRKWTEIFQLVSSSARDSGRLSLSTLDNHAWTSSFSAAVDSTSSSSNFSSNRDSMVSNSSSLINRMSARADIGDNIKEVVNSEDKLMSTKQHQPLPCPPEELQVFFEVLVIGERARHSLGVLNANLRHIHVHIYNIVYVWRYICHHFQ